MQSCFYKVKLRLVEQDREDKSKKSKEGIEAELKELLTAFHFKMLCPNFKDIWEKIRREFGFGIAQEVRYIQLSSQIWLQRYTFYLKPAPISWTNSESNLRSEEKPHQIFQINSQQIQIK